MKVRAMLERHPDLISLESRIPLLKPNIICTGDEFHMQQWNKLRIVEISTFMLAQNNVGFSQKKYLLSSVSTKQYVALPFLNFTYLACITSVRVKTSAVVPNL